jgi:hypothetical protein
MAVRCPSCKTENATEARRCTSCGKKFRRPRRRSGDADEDGQLGSLGGPATVAAFRCTALGLIPGLGLVCGPVGVVLALRAYRLEKAGPPRKGSSPALGVLALAAGVLVTSWAGVLLMIHGLSAMAR